MRRVAALYVDPAGVYAGLDDVELWDEARDARLYGGPWPVVAHPPCARWSRLAGFTEARFGYKRGDDDGCFAAALEAVRTYGGVLEHPAYSQAWRRYDLPRPITHHGWTLAFDGGASCYVEQGRYGLPVKKATWLYAYGVELPDLEWGHTPDGDGDEPNGEWGGLENWRDRWQAPKEGAHPKALSGAWRVNRHNGMRSSTPPPFRDVLLQMARTATALAEPEAIRREEEVATPLKPTGSQTDAANEPPPLAGPGSASATDDPPLTEDDYARARSDMPEKLARPGLAAGVSGAD